MRRETEQVGLEVTLDGSNLSHLLHAGFLLGFSFGPEDEGNIFLRNVG
jgi:hypothetical protein